MIAFIRSLEFLDVGSGPEASKEDEKVVEFKHKTKGEVLREVEAGIDLIIE